MASPIRIPVTPIPPTVHAARRLLMAIRDADLPLAESVAIGQALDVLLDVCPAYPPQDVQDGPTAPEAGIRSAVSLLGEALDEASSIPDLCRYAETLILLHDILDRLGRPSAAQR